MANTRKEIELTFSKALKNDVSAETEQLLMDSLIEEDTLANILGNNSSSNHKDFIGFITVSKHGNYYRTSISNINNIDQIFQILKDIFSIKNAVAVIILGKVHLLEFAVGLYLLIKSINKQITIPISKEEFALYMLVGFYEKEYGKKITKDLILEEGRERITSIDETMDQLLKKGLLTINSHDYTVSIKKELIFK